MNESSDCSTRDACDNALFAVPCAASALSSTSSTRPDTCVMVLDTESTLCETWEIVVTAPSSFSACSVTVV